MSARMRRLIATAVLLVSGLAAATAWQWPVPAPAISRTFGQDAGGYLLRGVELGGGAQPVFPVEAGIVVASHRERSDVPSGLGSFVVVEHEQAFRSVYAHLDAELLPRVGQPVEVDTQIGTVGESGLVQGRALRLSIIDLESGWYVNPMLLLPDLPDSVRPAVDAVYARNASALYDLDRTSTLPPGTYEITAAVRDRVSADRTGATVAPYSIRMFVAGQETFSTVMDRIAVRPDATTIEPGGATAEVLYGVEGLIRLGKLTVGTGQTEVEIVALDFAGNESSWDYDITGSGTPNEDVQ